MSTTPTCGIGQRTKLPAKLFFAFKMVLYAVVGAAWGGSIIYLLPDYPAFQWGIALFFVSILIGNWFSTKIENANGAPLMVGVEFLAHLFIEYGSGLALGALFAAGKQGKNGVNQTLLALGFAAGLFLHNWQPWALLILWPASWLLAVCLLSISLYWRCIGALGLIPLTIISTSLSFLPYGNAVNEPVPPLAALTASLLPQKGAPRLLHVSSENSDVDRYWRSFPHIKSFECWKINQAKPAIFWYDDFNFLRAANPVYDLVFVENLPAKNPKPYLKILETMGNILIVPNNHAPILPATFKGTILAGSNGKYMALSLREKIPPFTPENWDELWQIAAKKIKSQNFLPPGILAGLLTPVKSPLKENINNSIKKFSPSYFWCYTILLVAAIIFLIPKSEPNSQMWFAFVNGMGGVLLGLLCIQSLSVNSLLWGIPLLWWYGIFALMWVPMELRRAPFNWLHIGAVGIVIWWIIRPDVVYLSIITGLFVAILFSVNHTDLSRHGVVNCLKLNNLAWCGMVFASLIYALYWENSSAFVPMLILGAYPFFISIVRGKI